MQSHQLGHKSNTTGKELQFTDVQKNPANLNSFTQTPCKLEQDLISLDPIFQLFTTNSPKQFFVFLGSLSWHGSTVCVCGDRAGSYKCS